MSHRGMWGKSSPCDSILTPETIGNLGVWFDFSDLDTLTLGVDDSVISVEDKTGNGNTGSPTGPSTSPIVVSSSPISNKRACYFSGAQNIRTNYARNQPFSVFSVAKYQDIGGSFGTVHTGGVSSSHRSGQLYARSVSNSFATFSGIFLQGAGSFDVLAHHFQTVANGSSSELWVDGTLIAAGNSGLQNLQFFQLGAQLETSNSFIGHIGEVMLFEGIPTIDERIEIENYLKCKWFT